MTSDEDNTDLLKKGIFMFKFGKTVLVASREVCRN